MREHEVLMMQALSMLMEWAVVAGVWWLITKCWGLDFTFQGVAGAWLVRQLVTVKIGVGFKEDEQ